MTMATVHEAKTHLSRLIREALAGGEVVICHGRSGEELVKLVSARPPAGAKRVPGRLAHLTKGKDPLAHGFWEPLSEDHLGLGC